MNTNKSVGPLSRVSGGRAAIFDDARGTLGVIDIVKHAPFTPVRLFWVSGVQAGQSRGGHAHRLCSQFLVCISGRVRVDTFDGTTRQTFLLIRGEFINVVPGIFATETYLDEGTVLLVLCDRPYEPDDYIDDESLLGSAGSAGSEPR